MGMAARASLRWRGIPLFEAIKGAIPRGQKAKGAENQTEANSEA